MNCVYLVELNLEFGLVQILGIKRVKLVPLTCADILKKVSCHLSIMAKVTFGFRRLSDALDMLTPKRLKKKKYFRLGDEDEDFFVTKPEVMTSQESPTVSETLEGARECPLSEQESLPVTHPKV